MTVDELVVGVAALLVTYAIHSTLILGAAWLVTRALGHRLARADLVWKVALAGSLIAAPTHALVGVPAIWSIDLRAALSLDGGAGPGSRQSLADASTSIGPLAPVPRLAVRFAIALWALGSIGGLWRLFATRRRFHRSLANRRRVTGGPLRRMVDELGRPTRSPGRTRVSVSEKLSSPLALGRGEICLPERLPGELRSRRLRALLAHEMAHLLRRDPFWLVAAAALERVFFFQPLHHLARRGLHQSMEVASDAWAVRRTGDPIALAECLALVARSLQRLDRAPAFAGFATTRSPLVTRIERILTPRHAELGHAPSALAVALVMLSFVALPRLSGGHAVVDSPPDSAERYLVTAHDPAGDFTLSIEDTRVVAGTLDGVPIPADRLHQSGSTLHVLDANGGTALTVEVRSRGIEWTARPRRPPAVAGSR